VPAQRATSLRRGTSILVALGSDDALDAGGLGVVRIAQLVGQDKSQVSRALAALADAGLVDRDPDTRAYRLGWGLFALAARAGRPRLLAVAPAVLSELVAAIGETAHLSVLQADAVLTLLSHSSPAVVTARDWSGRTVPLTCTSSGQALLLDRSAAELAPLFAPGQPAAGTTGAPVDAQQLHRRIVAARERGYAIADEELEPGLFGIAAPVRDFSGQIVAAVNVSGPSFRLGPRARAASEAVRRAAARLSQALAGGRDRAIGVSAVGGVADGEPAAAACRAGIVGADVVD
jgi:IclR family transcriptional regulator, KDG regulon repressor